MPMSSDPDKRAKQLAAIKPHSWQPGQSGNPNGRKTLGACLNECVNSMRGKTYTEVQRIAKDKDEPIERRGAAKRVMGLLKDGYHGHIPLAGNDFDRIMDRTVGKPVQSLLVQHSQSDDADALTEQIRQMLARDPELCRVLGEQAPTA